MKTKVVKNIYAAKDWLDEAVSLIEENTIDSLLRYFQTGKTKKGEHLPSLLIEEEYVIENMLAEKMRPIVKELGFQLNEEMLKERGELIIEYVKKETVLSFATIVPYSRTLKFHFDFVEMEREREVRLENIKRKISDTRQRYIDNKTFLNEHKGIKKMKYSKILARIEETVQNISKEINALEKEITEIHEQKVLLGDIKRSLSDIEYHFRKYGFLIEFVKGEEYEV